MWSLTDFSNIFQKIILKYFRFFSTTGLLHPLDKDLCCSTGICSGVRLSWSHQKMTLASRGFFFQILNDYVEWKEKWAFYESDKWNRKKIEFSKQVFPPALPTSWLPPFKKVSRSFLWRSSSFSLLLLEFLFFLGFFDFFFAFLDFFSFLGFSWWGYRNANYFNLPKNPQGNSRVIQLLYLRLSLVKKYICILFKKNPNGSKSPSNTLGKTPCNGETRNALCRKLVWDRLIKGLSDFQVL